MRLTTSLPPDNNNVQSTHILLTKAGVTKELSINNFPWIIRPCTLLLEKLFMINISSSSHIIDLQNVLIWHKSDWNYCLINTSFFGNRVAPYATIVGHWSCTRPFPSRNFYLQHLVIEGSMNYGSPFTEFDNCEPYESTTVLEDKVLVNGAT